MKFVKKVDPNYFLLKLLTNDNFRNNQNYILWKDLKRNFYISNIVLNFYVSPYKIIQEIDISSLNKKKSFFYFFIINMFLFAFVPSYLLNLTLYNDKSTLLLILLIAFLISFPILLIAYFLVLPSIYNNKIKFLQIFSFKILLFRNKNKLIVYKKNI